MKEGIWLIWLVKNPQAGYPHQGKRQEGSFNPMSLGGGFGPPISFFKPFQKHLTDKAKFF